jgi:hypothetical protein
MIIEVKRDLLQDIDMAFIKKNGIVTGSHLKNRILDQGQGGTEFQPAGILKYFEELKRGTNTEIGPKDFFEMASNRKACNHGIHP